MSLVPLAVWPLVVLIHLATVGFAGLLGVLAMQSYLRFRLRELAPVDYWGFGASIFLPLSGFWHGVVLAQCLVLSLFLGLGAFVSSGLVMGSAPGWNQAGQVVLLFSWGLLVGLVLERSRAAPWVLAARRLAGLPVIFMSVPRGRNCGAPSWFWGLVPSHLWLTYSLRAGGYL